MLLRAQWKDGQQSPWWKCAWRMWLVEFLWRMLPPTGLSFVFLWELGVSQVWARVQLALKVSSPTLQLDFVDGLLPPIPSSDPMFLFRFSVWATIAHWVWEPEKQALQGSVWTFLSGTAVTDVVFFCVSAEGDWACQWGGLVKGKSQEISQIPENELRSVSHLGSHHTPIHGKPFFLCLLCESTLTHPGDCCFHVKKFPLICGNVSGMMEVCLAFFFWRCSFIVGLLVHHNHCVWLVLWNGRASFELLGCSRSWMNSFKHRISKKECN